MLGDAFREAGISSKNFNKTKLSASKILSEVDVRWITACGLVLATPNLLRVLL